MIIISIVCGVCVVVAALYCTKLVTCNTRHIDRKVPQITNSTSLSSLVTAVMLKKDVMIVIHRVPATYAT